MIEKRDPWSGASRFSASRRSLLGLVALLATSRWAHAQGAGGLFRVGWLASTENSLREPYSLAFVARLRELGFVEGGNLSIIRRHGDGRIERLPERAAELVKLGSDVLFGGGPQAALNALMQASRDTPIVFLAVDFDPVSSGHVASMARPGGLVTGVTAAQSQLPAKRLQLIKELLPNSRIIAVFANDQTTQQLEVAREAAARLGLTLHVVHFKQLPYDYEAAFADAVRARADALFALGSAFFVPARRKIPQLAVQARLPSVFHHSQWAEFGGLMSYGFNFASMYRTCAEMVTKILRGAKAADIPMEQPTNFELTINLKTARALGIKIPPHFQLRVDRFFE